MERSNGSDRRPASRARKALGAAALAAVALAAVTTPASAASAAPAPEIHAHRGGPLTTGPGGLRPAFVEEGLAAYSEAARRGFVLEVDAKLSADGVPIAIHDPTLDRTTDCAGEVQAMSAEQLRNDCLIDLLGTDDVFTQLEAGDPRLEPVPALAEVLELGDRMGVRVNLEIKNVPTDPDFDITSEYADTVVAAIKASNFPPERLIVQSFWPPNLDVIEQDPYFEKTPTSFLTLEQTNDGGPALAAESGYEYVSPAWPVDDAYVAEAHGLGLRVVPYTIDEADGIREAEGVGVDAVITNDPRMARAALRKSGDCANVRVGTAGDDTIPGYGAPEKLKGRGGGDELTGRGGADCVKGGPGDDELVAGPGHDRVRCGAGDDSVIAGRSDRVADDCEKVEIRRG